MMASSRRYQPALADPWTGVGDGGALAVTGVWRLVMKLYPESGMVRGTLGRSKSVLRKQWAPSGNGLRGGHADCTFRRFGRIFAAKSFDQV
jgi:hypothetical protein